MRAFVQKGKQGGPPLETDTLNKVLDLIAIESAGGCQDDEIAAALDQVRGTDSFRGLGVFGVFGDELEILVLVVEDSGGSMVINRDRHPTFRSD